MMRVFQVDVLECENCGGRLRIIAAIHPARYHAENPGLPWPAFKGSAPRARRPRSIIEWFLTPENISANIRVLKTLNG